MVDVDPAGAPPGMRLSRTRDGAYRRVSPRHATPSAARKKVRKGVVPAVCGFHFELIDDYVDAHPDQLFLHAAAVECAGRLVVFPAVAHAGKSTLAIYHALAGDRVFCDDALPIDTTTLEGIGFGILPRLRKARPGAESKAFRDFVRERAVLTSRNRIYVDLRPGLLAPLGEARPIGTIVLLDRRERGRTRLEPIDKADALETIVLQNFARSVPGATILDALHRIVEQADCLRLTFSSSADACRVVRRSLA